MSTPKVDLKSLWVNSGRKKYFIALGVTGCLAIGALGSTLAANISLNSGEVVEFGQGIVQTTACSGEDSLTVTPESTFINEVGAGAHYFTSLTVSDIPQSCLGATFTLAAYDADEIRSWSDCTDPGHQLSVLFTETQTVPTDASFALMYSNVTDSNANSFTVTWVGSQFNCRSSILAGDLRALTIQSSGNPVGYVGYVADYTPGSTSFVSDPLVSVDANNELPSGLLWSNDGTLAGSGDISLTDTLTISSSANSYLEFVDGRYAQGSIGNIGTTADRISVEFWVNFQVDPSSGDYNARLFSFNTDNQDDRECGYGLFFSDGLFGVNTCNNEILGIDVSNRNNQWHHIVWIASTGSRYTQKLYFNGVLQDLNPNWSGYNSSEYARPNIGDGNFVINSWPSGQNTFKLGAFKIYEGEMPESTVVLKSSSFQTRD
jgi:hypothetical protein